MRKFYLFLLVTVSLSLFGMENLYAQEKVSGLVKDEDGQPVVGVLVLEEGTQNATTTDLDGKFELRVSSLQKAVLEFRLIGYKTGTKPLAGSASVEYIMKSEDLTLDEVVVVGYGVQKKINMTASIASVDFEKEMNGRPVVNVASALAGLAPGLSVQQTSGKPGGESTALLIRGATTFNSTGPLVLVDGVEWNMNDLNPHDVESISVLKDASSTAIYGARAANGVILVTTKKGTRDQTKVQYSYAGIFQEPHLDLAFVSDYARHMELVNEATENMGTANIFSQASIDAWRAAQQDPYGLNEFGVPNYVAYPNTNWFDTLFDTGYSQEHNLSISGGGEKYTYLVSVGYLDNEGVMNKYNMDSSTQRISFRSNVEVKPYSWLAVGTRLMGQKQDYGMTNPQTAFDQIYMTTPGIHPGIPNHWGVPANIKEESSNANNMFAAMGSSVGSNETYRINGTLYGIVSPMKGLTLEGSFNYSPSITNRNAYSRPNGRWDYVEDKFYSTNSLDNAGVTKSNSETKRLSIDALARYNITIDKDHDVAALVGYNQTEYLQKGWSAQKQGAIDWALSDLNTFEDIKALNSTAEQRWGLRSWFGRVNYAYQSKYLFEMNARYDASSRFGPKNRWGFFPSLSAGWRMTEESFMKGIDPISNLKLRMSWGKIGNNQMGNYPWQATYSVVNVVQNGSIGKGLAAMNIANPALKWETTETTNFGVELGLFNNRLTAEIDVYNKYTSGLLFEPVLYDTMGDLEAPTENLAKLTNKGVEVSVKWQSKIGRDFNYNAGVNMSFNKTRVGKYQGKEYKYWVLDEHGNRMSYFNNHSQVSVGGFGGLIAEDRMLGETYIRRMYRGTGDGYTGGAVDVNAGPKDGMIRTEADMAWVKAMIDAGYKFNGVSTVSRGQLWYGDLLYADSNEDGDYGDTNDMDYTGHSNIPKMNLGFNLGASWKGIDLNMQWAGSFGHYLMWTSQYFNTPIVTNGHGVAQRIADDHYFYDPENPSDPRTNQNGKFPRLTFGENKNGGNSKWYEYKADYLKLKNIQVGYTLPAKITKKFLVNSLRLYVSGDNLITITDYPGLDPEIGTAMTYPLMKSYSFGVQVTL